MNIGNNKNMSFNKPSSNIDKSIIEKIDKKVDDKIQEFTEIVDDLEKIEISDEEPTDENVVIWVNTAQDSIADIMLRINDETVASNTVWSSEKINSRIQNIEEDSHIHSNKEAIDRITTVDIDKWNSKSDFSGSYDDLINKPTIPSINGLATEEYVNNAIDNIPEVEIPIKVSQLENDSGYITEIPSEYITEQELEDKGYLINEDIEDLAKKVEIPIKVSQLENDSGYITEIPSEYITEQELNGYATEEYVDEVISNIDISEIDLSDYAKKEDIEDLNTVISSDIEPTDDSIILWVNTSQEQNIEPAARINDNIVSNGAAWSSEKIFNQYNELLEKYNLLLRRVRVLEGVGFVGEGKVDQCIVE